jgi:hypothetical protein
MHTLWVPFCAFPFCAFSSYINGQPLEGFMDMNDPTQRYSNREFFKNIAPLICELKALGGPLVLSTAGTTQLSLDGAFFGQRTWATVRRLCLFSPVALEPVAP